MWVYAISIAAAFVVAMMLVIISDYRTPEQKAEFEAQLAAAGGHLTVAEQDSGVAAAPAAAAAAAPAAVATMVATRTVGAPVAGKVVPLAEVNDKVFASKALGDGVGIVPTDGHVTAPVAGTMVTVADTGHAFGIKTDDGVEVLVHVGIDTVQMEGKGFKLDVSKDMRVEEGDLLATVDLDAVKEAGFDPTTIVVVINTATLKSVAPVGARDVGLGDTIIDVQV
jgi:PTS system beta-glucosides-specific IIC component